jgi:hypothetical protein
MSESKASERNVDLFFQIADILDFMPQQYDQETWGEFAPTSADAAKFIEMVGKDVTDDPVEDFGTEDARWLKVEGCNTRMCVAGWAANLSGFHPVLNAYNREFNWAYVSKNPNSEEGDHVEDVARDLLGITSEEARVLFGGSAEWDSDDLRQFGKGARLSHDGSRVVHG